MADITTATGGWSSLSGSDKLYAASTAVSAVSNIASSIFNYNAAGEQAVRSVKAAKRQRDRTIREMTEAFVQQEAAEKISLWESGLQYRGTAEAIEESNIKTRETQLEETRQYYADLIKDLRRAERASKGSALSSALTSVGTIVGGIAGSIIPGAGTMAGAAIGGMAGGVVGGVAAGSVR